MRLRTKKPWNKKAVSLWNKLDAMHRLEFILEHQGLFVGTRLIRPGELLAAKVSPQFARKYIIEHDESPFFSEVDIKKKVGKQKEDRRLEEALWLAFH